MKGAFYTFRCKLESRKFRNLLGAKPEPVIQPKDFLVPFRKIPFQYHIFQEHINFVEKYLPFALLCGGNITRLNS